LSKCITHSQVDLTSLDEAELKSFFINVYNSLVIHALIIFGPATNAISRNSFFNNVYYNIGGFKFSLSDIEHGILRANQPPPIEKSVRVRFQKNDPRLAFMLPKLDPRIHFALVCGARSCPAIRVFSPENVEMALTWASEGFCAEETFIDTEKKKVVLSQLFNWYRKDFGDTNENVLRWISRHLPEEKQALLEEHNAFKTFSVSYSEYDWDMNHRYDRSEGDDFKVNLSDASGSTSLIAPATGWNIHGTETSD
jgi:hypothetical protein